MTVTEAGWSGKQNGELLGLAAEEFDVFVTIDQNLAAQQTVSEFGASVIVLVARSNRFLDLQPLVPQLLESIASAKAGQLTRVGA